MATPLDRYDAVVVGAGIEGLACALALARSGRKTACIDAHENLEAVARPVTCWISAADAQALDLTSYGLRFDTPPPVVAMAGTQTRVLWPDLARTQRGLRELSGQAWEAVGETLTELIRMEMIWRDPSASMRAVMAASALVLSVDPAAQELGHFMRSSAADYLAARIDDPVLAGAMAAMAAEYCPVAPDAFGSAPGLLSIARMFEPDAARPVLGGQVGALRALARAFAAQRGDLILGQEVREATIERETAQGVALASGATIKSTVVVAALRPRRLAQGLLNTRRYGRAISQLRDGPRPSLGLFRLEIRSEVRPPVSGLSSGNGAFRLWLGASIEALCASAHAFDRRLPPPANVFGLDVSADRRSAIGVIPFMPQDLSDGPWTDGQRAGLASRVKATLAREWPDGAAACDDITLIRPRAPSPLGGTGAIFGATARATDLGAFLSGGAARGRVLKGFYLCNPGPLDNDLRAGMTIADLAAGAAAKD